MRSDYSLLTSHYLILTPLPTTDHSPLTTHYPPLITHYSLLTTHNSLLTTHYSLLQARAHGKCRFLWSVRLKYRRGS